MQETMNALRAEQAPALDDAEHVGQWLSEFEEALRAGDRAQLEQLFVEDAQWRDLIAFTWNVTPSDGREAVISTLLREQPRAQAQGFAISPGHTAPRRVKRAGLEVIEAIFEFETAA